MLTEKQIKKWADYLMRKAQEECEKNKGDAKCNKLISEHECPGHCGEGVTLLMVLKGQMIPDEMEVDKYLAKKKKPKKKSQPKKSDGPTRYAVDFYDMMDGWIHYQEIDKKYLFGDLDEAKRFCDEKNSKLDQSNKNAGEHWGVIDLRTGLMIYRSG